MKHTFLLPLCLLLLISCKNSSTYCYIQGNAQGGTYHITYSPIDTLGNQIPLHSDSVKFVVDRILSDIDNSLSGYNPYSTLTKINSNDIESCDTLFDEIFTISKAIYYETNGYFDPSAAPLFDIWGFGFKNNEEPSKEKIDSILSFVGMNKVDIISGKIIKNDPRLKLNFNAIAQGYSCDIIARALQQMGLADYLVEVGMEIYCSGKNPKGKPWQIGIDMPTDGNMVAGEDIADIIGVTDAGVVTSGNYRKFYIKDGKKYSHTIDPIVGAPVQHNLLSATIVAQTSALADAYATYCMVIGVEKSIEFINSRDDIHGYLIYDKDGEMSAYYSDYFKKQ